MKIRLIIFCMWMLNLLLAIGSFLYYVQNNQHLIFNDISGPLRTLVAAITPQLVLVVSFFFEARPYDFNKAVKNTHGRSRVSFYCIVLYNCVLTAFILIFLTFKKKGGFLEDSVDTIIQLSGYLSFLFVVPMLFLFKANSDNNPDDK